MNRNFALKIRNCKMYVFFPSLYYKDWLFVQEMERTTSPLKLMPHLIYMYSFKKMLPLFSLVLVNVFLTNRNATTISQTDKVHITRSS